MVPFVYSFTSCCVLCYVILCPTCLPARLLHSLPFHGRPWCHIPPSKLLCLLSPSCRHHRHRRLLPVCSLSLVSLFKLGKFFKLFALYVGPNSHRLSFSLSLSLSLSTNSGQALPRRPSSLAKRPSLGFATPQTFDFHPHARSSLHSLWALYESVCVFVRAACLLLSLSRCFGHWQTKTHSPEGASE